MLQIVAQAFHIQIILLRIFILFFNQNATENIRKIPWKVMLQAHVVWIAWHWSHSDEQEQWSWKYFGSSECFCLPCQVKTKILVFIRKRDALHSHFFHVGLDTMNGSESIAEIYRISEKVKCSGFQQFCMLSNVDFLLFLVQLGSRTILRFVEFLAQIKVCQRL